MPDDPIGQKYNHVAKHVVTTSDAPLNWANSHAVPDMEGIARLKQEDGPDLLMWGSSTLYPQLLRHGLIDRLLLMIFPLVLGTGKRPFGDGTPPGALRLTESRTSQSGVLIASYEPAGKVELGSFASPEPSEAEVARREKVKREG
jgi:dihydrofolate reductase